MERIKKLQKALDGKAALIFGEHNRRYLTGFAASDGALLITKDDAVLFADSRYIENAKKQSVCEARLTKELDAQIADVLAASNARELSAEYDIPYRELARLREKLSGVKVVPDRALSETIERLRSVKDAAEVELIRCAQEITDAAFLHILNYVKVGVSEKELAAELIYFMLKNGADGEAFKTIVLAGSNTSVPHGVPSDYRIKQGDFVQFDFGARFRGYCSDMSRAAAVGSATDRQLEVYETVLRAQSAALAAARAGITGCALDKTARSVIEESPFKGTFGHGLGHSLGLQIHERPSASPINNGELAAGVIMTVEPGIYLEGEFGVRIEDMALLKENGAENLTKSSKNPVI